MKAPERIFLYTILAILVFYVFLADGNVESQVAIQEEIRAKSLRIVNDEGQATIFLKSDEFYGGGQIQIYNKYNQVIVMIAVDTNNEGYINISDGKEGRSYGPRLPISRFKY